jgi:hypothetical protein
LWEDAMLAGVLCRRCFGWLTDLVLVVMLVGALWLSLLLLGLVTFGLGWWSGESGEGIMRRRGLRGSRRPKRRSCA